MSLARKLSRYLTRPLVRAPEGGQEGSDPDVTLAVELTAGDGAYLCADDGITKLTAD